MLLAKSKDILTTVTRTPKAFGFWGARPFLSVFYQIFRSFLASLENRLFSFLLRLRRIPISALISPILYLFRSPRWHTFLKESIKELFALL